LFFEIALLVENSKCGEFHDKKSIVSIARVPMLNATEAVLRNVNDGIAKVVIAHLVGDIHNQNTHDASQPSSNGSLKDTLFEPCLGYIEPAEQHYSEVLPIG
jgi:hypothetical protein